MGYKLDKKKVAICNAKKIGSQKSADYYKYKNAILVLLKEQEDNLDYETADLLTTITTERILLPRKILYYNNIYCGYSLNKPTNYGSNKKIISMSKENLLGEISLLERDLEVLSHKKILLSGVNPDNTITQNGKIVLIDPIKYSKLDIYSTEKLENVNKYQLHLLLTELIVRELHKGNYSNSEILEIKNMFNSKEDIENSSEFIAEILEDSENIKQLIKRI